MANPEVVPTERSQLTVVAIGASAGGLRALQELFAGLPPDTGLAFVVVVHLAPERESHLAALLQPHAAIPVRQVTETVPLEPNHVYVIPPGRNLDAVDSSLRLSELEPERSLRAPVDHFFRMLAETWDGSSIGVILSGTGTDGAQGVRHIRERGGMVIVQDPEEAEYDGMPRSAIATGMVDVIAPISKVLDHIVGFLHTHPRITPGPVESGVEADVLQNILTALRVRTGQDFLRYKRTTVSRRVTRRMQVLGVEDLAVYLEILRESSPEATALLDDLLINVTSFFRDPEVFEGLEADVLPRLLEGKTSADRIRVWSVGCSTGEEAYSIAMLLLEAAERRPEPPQIQVFASDLHDRSLRFAREGVYSDVIAEHIRPDRLRRFFRKEEGGYRVGKELRDLVVFAVHSLLHDPPFSRVDLILCRNVLIYLQADVQRGVVDLFHYALQRDGYLQLGSAETLDQTDLFRLENKSHHLYRKRAAPRGELRLPALMGGPTTWPRAAVPPGPGPHPEAAYGVGAAHQRMVELYTPPSMLLDDSHNIVHLSEHAGRYLQQPGGVPTSNAFKLVREELRVELRAVLHAAAQGSQIVLSRPIPVQVDGVLRSVVLRVTASSDKTLDRLVLVIFDDGEPPAAVAPATGTAVERAGQEDLEAELELSRNRLQAILEEFETSQEEMRASNEELQSANEELRSTMEELETSREELQSMNEELQTLNQENKHKVEELSGLTNDLQNLLQATDVATLFLDRHLRILRFTPRVSETFSMRHSDIGRPLADLTHSLGYPALIEDASRVLQALVPVEREVETADGLLSYVVRVTPYRTMDDRIDGVVISLVDISALKRSTRALQESALRFRTVANLVPDLLWESGPDGSTLWCNDRWYAYTGQTAADALGGEWLTTVHREDRESARRAFDQAIAEGLPLEQECRMQGVGGLRWFLVRVEPLHDTEGRALRWVGSASDIHERRLALQDAEGRVAERTEALGLAEEDRTSLRRQLALAEEGERRRLARELHDQLGQSLTALALGLDRTRRLMPADAPAIAPLDQLSELTGSMTRAVRYLTLELRPPELDDVGLASAMDTYVEQWSARYGIAAEVASSVVPDREALVEVDSTLYRMLQEALTNVAKHAGARHVSVILEERDGLLRLVVEDDGRGFDVESTQRRARLEGRLGLAGLGERAALVGGTLTIESSPGSGTTLYVKLPRPQAKQ